MISFDAYAAAFLLREQRELDCSVAAIARVIEARLEETLVDAETDPEYYFAQDYQFWSALDAAVLGEENQSTVNSQQSTVITNSEKAA